jgi:branched-chain amino acid transport system ATP-binding protein
MTQPIVEIQNLSLSYGPIEAVRDVDLAIESGQVVAVLGANGAGKSTLLKGIAGLVPVKKGVIRYQGKDVNSMPAHRRVANGICLAPEGRQVFSDQTVADNLLLGAYSRKLGAIALRDEIAERSTLFPRLAERRDQLASTLSGGEQQMLAIARALMAAPKLLLLDEPSLGLAPRIIDDVYAVIHALKGRGMTIVIVEQMGARALELADRAYVLETGSVVLSGTGAELLEDPRVQSAYLGAS